MGLNDTPSSERTHIGFFGNRNAGKSSLFNAVTCQKLSVVSDVPGTTTDTVKKSMEILPLGPVVLMDTPGFDDEGALGSKRVGVSSKTLAVSDAAVLVIDAALGMTDTDKLLISRFKEQGIPYIVVYNKIDVAADYMESESKEDTIYVSAKTGENIDRLKDMLGRIVKPERTVSYVSDFVNKGDLVILVVPIDSAAPKGRLILPEQQAIREILDSDGMALTVKEDALAETLYNIGIKPALVITDSQVFEYVSRVVPEEIPLTSFSILMARYKGFLDRAIEGARVLDQLSDGDRVLICEGCTHHRQCDDIGTVKLPAMIRKFSGKKIDFIFTSGHEFTDNPGEYKLMIHCGGCMLGRKEVLLRMKAAKNAGIPVTNYGTSIAFMKGILDRSTQIMKH